MPIVDATTFEISGSDPLPDATIERVRGRLQRIAHHCREPVSHVEFRLVVESHHYRSDRVRAEATLEIVGGPIRAHYRANTLAETVDGTLDRLRRNVERHGARLHREQSKHASGVATPGSWRHGDLPDAPRRPVPVPDHEPTVVRHKSFASGAMTVGEAIFDLHILDHDFYLFEEERSGASAVISRGPGATYLLEITADARPDMPSNLVVERLTGPHVLDLVGAQRYLENSGEPHIFHRPPGDRSGQVLYRRHDGDYGVIELAVAQGR